MNLKELFLLDKYWPKQNHKNQWLVHLPLLLSATLSRLTKLTIISASSFCFQDKFIVLRTSHLKNANTGKTTVHSETGSAIYLTFFFFGLNVLLYWLARNWLSFSTLQSSEETVLAAPRADIAKSFITASIAKQYKTIYKADLQQP